MRVIPLLAFVFVLIATTATTLAQRFDVVETLNGPVEGLNSDTVRSFLGIPFGKPPIGNLRFASPQPAESWAPETLSTRKAGNTCPGTIQSFLDLIPFYNISEDCLYLNVWTPSRERISNPLPVLFWLYGGAFIFGDGYELGLYEGAYIASTRDVIVVTSNYRLGPFGFLVTEGADGNYGLEDQRLALKWVIDNIAAFGGDPKQITMFGESAGAMSTGYHLTSPLSDGLFQRAILQSNAAGLKCKSREQAMELSDRLAEVVDCPIRDLECLRQVPMNKLAFFRPPVLFAGMDHIIGDILSWGPTIDGKNILKQTHEAFEAGEFSKVPMIWGVNKDEFSLFTGLIVEIVEVLGLIVDRNITFELGPVAYRVLTEVIFKDKADQVLERYPAKLFEDNLPQMAEIWTKYVFHCPSRKSALSAVNSTLVYTYEFAHVPEYLPLFEQLGRICWKDQVCHAHELPFVFHSETLLRIPVSARFTPEEEKMSQTMIDYWTSFASGDVNGAAPPVQWETLDQSNQRLLEIETIFSSKQWDIEACDFWDDIGYNY